jgi:hypothetical protein
VFTEEHEDSKSGYSIDMRVEGKHAGADCVWAVEVDGPSHFLQVRTIPSRAVLPREEGTRRVQLVRGGGSITDLSVHSHRDRITSFQEVNRAHAQGANGRLPTGNTLLKRRQLGQLGYKAVSVPYWEWNALRRDKDQEQAYLLRALKGT